MPNTLVWGNDGPSRNADQDLVSLGNEIVQVANIADAARVALNASNKDGANSVAIEAEGQVKVTAVSTDNPASKGIHVINTSTNAAARALKVEGATEIIGTSRLDGAVTVTGSEGGSGSIDADDGPLWLGTGAGTETIFIGNQGKYIGIQGSAAHFSCPIEGNDNNLVIGGSEDTNNTNIGRAGQDVNIADDLNVGGNLVVGPGNAVGQVDAANDQNLNIGTAGSTADVVIGQGGQDAYVRSDELKVGPTAGAGSINSGGAPGVPMDLNIGDSADTANLVLLNGANRIDLMSDTRLNGKEFVANAVANLANAASCGFVYNAAGHGAGKSFDFYIDGNVVAYIDSVGVH